jgi:hypothetical protein
MCEESEESELSPKQAGPAVDDSGSGKICAISAIRGCLARSLSLLRGCRAVQSTYNAPPGHAASNTVAKAQCKVAAFPRSRKLCSRISIGRTLPFAWNSLLPVTNGQYVCLGTSYQRLSRLPSVVRYPLAAVGPGFPVMWRLLSCQNFSIKRTPERTLLKP